MSLSFHVYGSTRLARKSDFPRTLLFVASSVSLFSLGLALIDLTQLDRSVVSMVGTCVSLVGSVMEEGEHSGVGPMGCG